jgi:hypothetical protein
MLCVFALDKDQPVSDIQPFSEVLFGACEK